MVSDTLRATVKLLPEHQIDRLLATARRVGVLGIKPESRRQRSAHHIPAYLKDVGYEIAPVPVYYRDVHEILGAPVYRNVRDIPGRLDVLVVFRRPEHVERHTYDILAARPPVVWFQSGLFHLPLAERLVLSGIRLVHDCIGCRRASLAPSYAPLW